MRTWLASLVLLLAFGLLAACGDEDLKFGEPNDTPTPDNTTTPNATSTPVASPTPSPTAGL